MEDIAANGGLEKFFKFRSDEFDKTTEHYNLDEALLSHRDDLDFPKRMKLMTIKRKLLTFTQLGPNSESTILWDARQIFRRQRRE